MVDHTSLFNHFYSGKRVLITGITGFKGWWLATWLKLLGAQVYGYSLPSQTVPSHMQLLTNDVVLYYGDITDHAHLKSVFLEVDPDIVFHMAAQPLVRASYHHPLSTFETNIMGSLYVYDAARACNNCHAIVSVTTDKVYLNQETGKAYQETDSLGGNDPYSASKAAMEIVTHGYRHSFFNPTQYRETHQILLATARAGNVIGGGDWSEDRLVPDVVKACQKGESVTIRMPNAVRPWQHVLSPLSGYLQLGQRLLEGDVTCADAFNFGPNTSETYTVEQVLKLLKQQWSKVCYEVDEPKMMPHEAGVLSVDSTKACSQLQWKPVWDTETAIQRTIFWYQQWVEEETLQTIQDISDYVQAAKEQQLVWAT